MSKRGYGSTKRHRPSLAWTVNNLCDACIEWITSKSDHSHWLLCFPVSDLRYMKAKSEIWHFQRLLLHVVFEIRCSFETNRESNVTMDESSVAEEPKFSLSYISIVPEEPLISAWRDEDFSHGEETTRIESVADEMFEFGSTVTSTPAKRKRKSCEHQILQWAKYHSGSRRNWMHRWRNTRKLPSLEMVKTITT